MFAKIDKIECIPMSRYDYCKNIKKGVAHGEDKHLKGYYITALNVWITEDTFNKHFIPING